MDSGSSADDSAAAGMMQVDRRAAAREDKAVNRSRKERE